jgi:hypothetical protein
LFPIVENRAVLPTIGSRRPSAGIAAPPPPYEFTLKIKSPIMQVASKFRFSFAYPLVPN